ncbi:MAG: FAD-dependent oxidoreductase [Clostridiales bacterium]|nr:FAD-dependent oxidoreductase [Clostridiales bacterium]
MKKVDYLIVGGGIAAICAAKGIREIDCEGSILMIGEESLPPYKKPMLTKTPLYGWDPARMVMHDAQWYVDNGIELFTGTAATDIDPANHLASTDAETIKYGKLIYAAGGNAFVPPIPGADLPGVISIRNHGDISALRSMAVSEKRAVIIGGGVIGLEAGFEMSRYGIECTVLEALPRLMPRFLDEECAGMLQSLITEFPVHTGVRIEEIGGDDCVEYVRLEDGRQFPCGIVIMSTGARANTALAEKAGLACGRGVIINDKCETSEPDIYACGDCAEQNGMNPLLWSQAEAQGRAAGINAAGGDTVTETIDTSMVLHCPEIALFSLGDTVGDGLTAETFRSDLAEQPTQFAVNEKHGRAFEKRYYRDGRLAGAVIIGNLSNMHVLREQILRTAGDS